MEEPKSPSEKPESGAPSDEGASDSASQAAPRAAEKSGGATPVARIPRPPSIPPPWTARKQGEIGAESADSAAVEANNDQETAEGAQPSGATGPREGAFEEDTPTEVRRAVGGAPFADPSQAPTKPEVPRLARAALERTAQQETNGRGAAAEAPQDSARTPVVASEIPAEASPSAVEGDVPSGSGAEARDASPAAPPRPREVPVAPPPAKLPPRPAPSVAAAKKNAPKSVIPPKLEGTGSSGEFMMPKMIDVSGNDEPAPKSVMPPMTHDDLRSVRPDSLPPDSLDDTSDEFEITEVVDEEGSLTPPSVPTIDAPLTELSPTPGPAKPTPPSPAPLVPTTREAAPAAREAETPLDADHPTPPRGMIRPMSPVAAPVAPPPVPKQPPSVPPRAKRRRAAAPPPPSAKAVRAALQVTRDETVRKRLWWEELFTDDFGRAIPELSESQLATEVDFIQSALGAKPGAMILDLGCGNGRHAVGLAERGYSVVGYDLSVSQLAAAGELAQALGQKINFLQGDMREMSFASMFDSAYCWNATFGYFEEEKNMRVLQSLYHALKPGGTVLLDVVNRDFVIGQEPNSNWFEGDGCVCMDDMYVDFITSRMRVKRTVMLEDGQTRECNYSIRVYSLHELGKLMHDIGFRVTRVSGDIKTAGVFFGAVSPRILVEATKPT